jgi:hypothetical protein
MRGEYEGIDPEARLKYPKPEEKKSAPWPYPKKSTVLSSFTVKSPDLNLVAPSLNPRTTEVRSKNQIPYRPSIPLHRRGKLNLP